MVRSMVAPFDYTGSYSTTGADEGGEVDFLCDDFVCFGVEKRDWRVALRGMILGGLFYVAFISCGYS